MLIGNKRASKQKQRSNLLKLKHQKLGLKAIKIDFGESRYCSEKPFSRLGSTFFIQKPKLIVQLDIYYISYFEVWLIILRLASLEKCNILEAIK